MSHQTDNDIVCIHLPKKKKKKKKNNKNERTDIMGIHQN